MTERNDRQQHIVENLRESGWDSRKITNELPAIERVVDDLDGVRPIPFTRRNPPPAGSYLASNKSPGTANALLDNLSQRVMGELAGSQIIGKERSVDIGRALAVAADSIKENQEIWEGFGFMKNMYDESDVIENRYAEAAKMLATYMRTHPNLPFPSSMGTGMPGCDLCPDQTKDFSEWIEMFREWMNNLEAYFQIISKEIDRVIAAPTSRVRHLKIFTPDGDKMDITDLDLSHFNQITSDSLAVMASGRNVMAASLDDMTMYEMYKEEHRKYIDVFVVDQSGSMSGDKILKAAAFLYNRLQKVRDGYAMMAVVEFDTAARVYEIPEDLTGDRPRWMIDTPEKAKWAQTNIIKRYASFVGGGTDIPEGVRKGIQLAHEMEKLGGILPNISVVTDEDRSIGEMDAKSVDVPVNGLAVYGNSVLQNFCIETGGGYNNLEAIDLTVLTLGDYNDD